MSLKTYIKNHAVVVTIIALVVIVVMVIAGRAASKKPAETTSTQGKQVTLVEASTFRNDLSTVSVNGVVESVSQVDLKSQVSAPLTGVYVSVGDSVRAGQTIAEFQNADIKAQLDQARANLALAQGRYTSGNTSVDTTRKAALDKLRDNYSKTNDAITADIGQFLYNGNPNTTQLQSLITDSTLSNKLVMDWGNATDALRVWKNSIATLDETSTQSQVDASIAAAQKSLAIINTFLSTLTDALSNATQSAGTTNYALINSWKTTTSGVRATVSTAISSFTTTGGSIVTNDAQIAAAEAGIRNLKAQLSKTIIVSPITGKVAALPLRTGEFASPGQLITTVVGEGGLQVKAFASSEDFDRIAKNASTTIQGTVHGYVSAVAPSVNELNKKVEVTIVIPPGQGTSLVVGQNVDAKIEAVKAPSAASTQSSRAAYYILPIQNVKIVPGEAYVFTVDENSKIVKNPVTLGEVKGEYVEVKSGMTDDMKIISPVYELTEGDVVKN